MESPVSHADGQKDKRADSCRQVREQQRHGRGDAGLPPPGLLLGSKGWVRVRIEVDREEEEVRSKVGREEEEVMMKVERERGGEDEGEGGRGGTDEVGVGGRGIKVDREEEDGDGGGKRRRG